MKTIFKIAVFIMLGLFTNLLRSVSRQTNERVRKVRILQIDSTKYYYVFRTNSKSPDYSIVIAEKEKVFGCLRSKKYILTDSVKQSSRIKSENGYDFIGFNSFIIDKVKVKNAGVLTKYINNCEALSK
jgi:hypothetical protein